MKPTRGVMLVAFWVVAAGFAPAPAKADGFGWYVWFFDFADLQREFRGELGKRYKGPDLREILPEYRTAMEGSAFELLSIMEESGRFHLTRPAKYDEELLWAEALREFGEALERHDPNSPGRFLGTGRQFKGPENMPACGQTIWLHGACGAAVIYTPDEVRVLYREFEVLAAAKVKWSEPEMQFELIRLRDILKEAAKLGRAVFLYGYD